MPVLPSESQAQKDFAACFSRALRAQQEEIRSWEASPFRELVSGVHPRAVAGLITRTIVVFLDGYGLTAATPSKGDWKGADLVIGGEKFIVRSATAAKADRPKFTFHGLDKCVHRVVLIGFLPVQVYAWVINHAELAKLANTVQGDLRIDIDATTPPWSTDQFGSTLTNAIGLIR